MDPTVGAEIQKTRPALVVSNDKSNQYSQLITIVPITSRLQKVFLFEVAIAKGVGGLKKTSLIRVAQVRTVDKQRIAGGPLGSKVDYLTMREVNRALKIHLDLL